MKTLRIKLPVTARRSYTVSLVSGPEEIARRISGRYPGASKFLVCDKNVYPLYGRPILAGLRARGGVIHTTILPAGERNKSAGVKAGLDSRLLAAGVQRDSVIIALGGGVIGDLAGYTAATVLRGIRLVQVPTTLLAQVDSSVGGKVGINHPLGKNLVGAFHQPDAVYIATSTLQSLSQRNFRSGIAEVIKYGMILDGGLFRNLERSVRALTSRRSGKLGEIVAGCVRLKAAVVSVDEREAGYRRILNFGHTVGHAIERLSDYRLSHGYAVAIGMVVEGTISRELGLLRSSDLDRLRNVLTLYGLPTSIPEHLSAARVRTLISRDKKMTGGAVRYTLVQGVGKGKTGVTVPPDLLRKVLRT